MKRHQKEGQFFVHKKREKEKGMMTMMRLVMIWRELKFHDDDDDEDK
jgi:hypothetical protein